VTVRLLYFATFRDAAGVDEQRRNLPSGSTVASLWDELRAQIPYFAGLLQPPPAAVNREYVSFDHLLADGDEVAFLPPVAGG
jgi:molybdopterin converting factor subunit 1